MESPEADLLDASLGVEREQGVGERHEQVVPPGGYTESAVYYSLKGKRWSQILDAELQVLKRIDTRSQQALLAGYVQTVIEHG